jgi:hypothetical protein
MTTTYKNFISGLGLKSGKFAFQNRNWNDDLIGLFPLSARITNEAVQTAKSVEKWRLVSLKRSDVSTGRRYY